MTATAMESAELQVRRICVHLGALCAEQGIKIKEAASVMGVSETTARAIFKGQRPFTVVKLDRICERLGLKLSEVVRAAEA